MRQKKLLLLIVFSLGLGSLKSQQLTATFLQGDLSGASTANFGTLGQSSKAHPEALADACLWYHDNKLYLFGGELKANNNTVNPNPPTWYNNRLWLYEPGKGWELLSGGSGNLEYDGSTLSTTSLNYGTKGQAAASNLPGARSQVAHAKASNGDLYLYGGFGQATDGTGALGDLWKFDGTHWTWVSGTNTKHSNPVRGTKGVADPANHPGARKSAALWFDDAGDLFLFGGSNAGYQEVDSSYNDLWKWDGSNWTWIDGDATLDEGVKDDGQGNFTYPPAIMGMSYCYASDGKAYLYGGLRHYAGSNISNPAFWSYDGQSWTHLGGNPNNQYDFSNPLGHVKAGLLELNGDLVLMTGAAFGQSQGYYIASSLYPVFYKYQNGNWVSNSTQVANNSLSNSSGVYLSSNLLPRMGCGAVAQGLNEIFIYGGYYGNFSASSYLLKYNGQNFAYLSDNGSNAFPSSGSANPNYPGRREGAASYYQSSSKTLFFYGGENSQGQLLADLWTFQGDEWIRIAGGTSSRNPVYGTQGLADPANHPGSRKGAHLWKDNGDTLWLFGGTGYTESGVLGSKADLWYYFNGDWVWHRGDKNIGSAPLHGQKNVAASYNNPGSRDGASLKVDQNGDAFLFGGLTGSGTVNSDYRNDLWKFNGLNWIWISGSSNGAQTGVFGTKGQAAAGNVPASTINHCMAINANGLYIYGGASTRNVSTVNISDNLWYYDFSSAQWTWLTGSGQNIQNASAVYGLTSDNNSNANPGPLLDIAALWEDNGELYLFGGSTGSSTNFVNDLWHYKNGQWSWLKGGRNGANADKVAQLGLRGQARFSHLPSARMNANFWKQDGLFYLFGGKGLYSDGTTIGALSDLWRFDKGNFWNGSSWEKGVPANKVEAVQVYQSGASVTSSLQTGDLFIDADLSLDLAKNNLALAGDIYVQGDLNNQGLITLNGSGSQEVKGALFEVDSLLTIEEGVVLETNDSLRIKAESALKYGQLLNKGTINDQVEFEYFLNLSSGANNGRYFHLGSVLDGVEAGDLKADGLFFTGDADPAKNCLWEWDAANANWSSPDPSATLSRGSALALYAGNNVAGNFVFADGNAGVIRIKGSAPNNNTKLLNCAYNDGQSSVVNFVGGASQSATEGWNFIANPFTHNIDVDQVLQSLNNKATYLWDGSAYASYVNGVATNGGTTLLAPGQGFYVQIDNSQAGLGLSFNGESLWNASLSPVRFKTSTTIDGLRASLFLDAQKKDETWCGFNPSATAGFDGDFDAWKFQSGGPNEAKLFIPISEGALSIATFNPYSTQEVPLAVDYGAGQGDSLNLHLNLDQLQSFTKVVLEDNKTGNQQDLTQNNNYAFIQDSSISPRFKLIFSGGLHRAERGNIKEQEIYHYQSNGLNYLQEVRPGRREGSLIVKVFNPGGILLESQVWLEDQDVITILEDKGAGVYLVLVEDHSGKRPSALLRVLKRP